MTDVQNAINDLIQLKKDFLHAVHARYPERSGPTIDVETRLRLVDIELSEAQGNLNRENYGPAKAYVDSAIIQLGYAFNDAADKDADKGMDVQAFRNRLEAIQSF